MDQPPKPLLSIGDMDFRSIIKLLLEDDVDESMYSEADVQALSAAFKRHIGWDSSTFSEPYDSQSVRVLPPASIQPKQEKSDTQLSEQPSSEIAKLETKDQDQKVEMNQARPSDQTYSQLPKQENSQQVKREPQDSSVNEANGAKRIKTAASSSSSSSSIPLQLLIPVNLPHLDKDRSMQLLSFSSRLGNKEETKEDFLKAFRDNVGDQRLRQAVNIANNQLKTIKERDEEIKMAFDMAVKMEIASLKQVVDDLRMQLAEEVDDLNVSCHPKGLFEV